VVYPPPPKLNPPPLDAEKEGVVFPPPPKLKLPPLEADEGEEEEEIGPKLDPVIPGAELRGEEEAGEATPKLNPLEGVEEEAKGAGD